MSEVRITDFDGFALFAALNQQREAQGLSWPGVAKAIWDQSYVLNEQRHDHPISPATLAKMRTTGATSCQHALFVLRWLERTPESFLEDPPGDLPVPAIPLVGPDRRLRWSLSAIYEALDDRRREQLLTWPQLARVLRCTPSQLTGLRTAKFAIGMNLTMRIVQWLQRPSSDFIYASTW